MINGYVRLWIVSQVIFGEQKRRRHSIKQTQLMYLTTGTIAQ
ncbi:hypothetical protein BN1180_02467 [Peribacillus simplex]|uniref:Uncharacterized protein n=1 Tax=Peribacillus simplex TaxID=1478 RepID=A0AAN2PHM2_9BACI|nr:hypothetical protein BN1180_02467 [Peribacillus simplex]